MLRNVNKILVLFLFLFSSSVSANETVHEVIHLHNRPASELQPLIAPLLEGSDRVLDNGNSLIVKTTTRRLPAIQDLIKQLDTVITNLSITVIHSQTKTAKDLNASAGIPINQAKKAGGYLHGFIGSTRGLNDNENLQVLRTLEGKAAYIKSAKIYQVQDISVYGYPDAYDYPDANGRGHPDAGYGYPSVSIDTEFIEVSTGFAVVPRLSGRQVILEVSPWSDNMRRQSGVIETQSAHTSIRTHLGEWVEIGSSHEDTHQQQQGFLSHRRSTVRNTTRILIKVDKIN